jgi:hypothetical protein
MVAPETRPSWAHENDEEMSCKLDPPYMIMMASGATETFAEFN